jgi:hypothetical protein
MDISQRFNADHSHVVHVNNIRRHPYSTMQLLYSSNYCKEDLVTVLTAKAVDKMTREGAWGGTDL